MTRRTISRFLSSTAFILSLVDTYLVYQRQRKINILERENDKLFNRNLNLKRELANVRLNYPKETPQKEIQIKEVVKPLPIPPKGTRFENISDKVKSYIINLNKAGYESYEIAGKLNMSDTMVLRIIMEDENDTPLC